MSRRIASAWLEPVMAVLDAVDQLRRVFFRDDDAGWDDPGLVELLDVFERHDCACDLAVIPAAITPGLTRSLLCWRRAGHVRLHQHGFRHLNHEMVGRKCEFGPSRSFEEHRADIYRGQKLMGTAFGGAADPIFTPPWNRCTGETGRALVDLGFAALSRTRSAGSLQIAALAEVPVAFDWCAAVRGRRRDRDELAEGLAELLVSELAIGVMLHHADMDADDREAVGDVLALVRSHPRIAPVTMVDLL